MGKVLSEATLPEPIAAFVSKYMNTSSISRNDPCTSNL